VELTPWLGRSDALDLDALKGVRGGQWQPEPAGVADLRELRAVNEFKPINAVDHTQQTPGRIFHRNPLPGAIPPLFPGIERLAIDFMDAGLGYGHRTGWAFHEEVHIVNVAVSPGQVHAREANAATEVCQILEMDADQFEAQLLLVMFNFEITAARLRLLGNVLLDPDGNIVHAGRWTAGHLGGRSPATGHQRGRGYQHRKNKNASRLHEIYSLTAHAGWQAGALPNFPC